MAVESLYKYNVTSYNFSARYSEFYTPCTASARCNYSLTTRDADNTTASGSTTGTSVYTTTVDYDYSITSYNPYNSVSDITASELSMTATWSYDATISNVSWPEISKSTSTTMTSDGVGELTFPMAIVSSLSSSDYYYFSKSTIRLNSYTSLTFTVDDISWSRSIISDTYEISMTSDLNVASSSTLTSYSYRANNASTVFYKTESYYTYTPGNLTTLGTSYEISRVSDVGQVISSSSTVNNSIRESIVLSSITGYSTYTITSGNFSATMSSFSFSSGVIETAVASTYTSLDIAQTVVDSDHYTYYTTFYGTILASIPEISSTVKSDTSWVNIAAVSKFTSTGENVYAPYKKSYGSTQGTSSFGNINYDMITTSISQESSSYLNNPSFKSVSSTNVMTTMLTSESNNGPYITKYSYLSSTWYEHRSFTLKDVYASVNAGYTSFYSLIDSVSSSNSYLFRDMSSLQISTTINTVGYGTTARISDMTGSSSWADVFNTYLVNNSAFSYNISSIWIYDTITSTLSEYSTVLVAQFTNSYNQYNEYKSVSYTQSSSTVVVTTEDRFINKNAISRYDTNIISYTNTVVVNDNGQTMATLNQSSTTMAYISSTSMSRITYTFISDKADFSSSESVISTETLSSARQQFINSISSVMNSTSEQQNDTLIFQSTVATISSYSVSLSFSTVSTMQVDYEATTYTDEYSPKSYSTSETNVSTSLNVETTLSSASNTAQVTQSIGYTPVYSTINGIYVTN